MRTDSKLAQTVRLLRKRTSLRPTFAVVLGSGFGESLKEMTIADEIPYRRLPGFPLVSVEGHDGKLTLGHLAGVPLLVLKGRAHFYEGHDMSAVTFPMRAVAAFGIRRVLIPNAAGGINRRLRPGDFLCLTDHINFMGTNPLRGETGDSASQFVDLSAVYNPAMRRLLLQAARETKVRVREGVYLAVSGPSYETPAEIRAFARLGADAVGMSTVPEAIVARQCGMAVTGLSCITNHAAGRSRTPISHEEVLTVGQRVQSDASKLLRRFVELQAQAAWNEQIS